GFVMNCKADVQFEKRHDHGLSTADEDKKFEMRCNDGDEDQDELRFEGKTKADIDEERTTLRGIRDEHGADVAATSTMDDDNGGIRNPIIVIFASDRE